MNDIEDDLHRQGWLERPEHDEVSLKLFALAVLVTLLVVVGAAALVMP